MAVTVGSGVVSRGAACVETSGGTKYALFSDPGSTDYLEIYKNPDGTPTRVAHESAVARHGSGAAAGQPCMIHGAMDSSDKIRVVSIITATGGATGDIVYRVFDTSGDSWEGSWTSIYTFTDNYTGLQWAWMTISTTSTLSIFLIDVIKYHGTPFRQLVHLWYDGSWNSETVSATGNEHYDTAIRASYAPSNDLEVMVKHGNYEVAYNRKNGSWGTEADYTYGSSTNSTTPGACLVTTGDTVYRSYNDRDKDIYENTTDTGYDVQTGAGHEMAGALDGTDRYIFYRDTDSDIHLIYNTGSGWVDGGDLESGTYSGVCAQWSYNVHNQTGEIDYLFQDGSNVYYNSYTLAGPVVFPPVPARVHRDRRSPLIRM